MRSLATMAWYLVSRGLSTRPQYWSRASEFSWAAPIRTSAFIRPRLARGGSRSCLVATSTSLTRPGLVSTAWHFSLQSERETRSLMVSSTTPASLWNWVRLERIFSRRKFTVQAAPSVSRPNAVQRALLISW